MKFFLLVLSFLTPLVSAQEINVITTEQPPYVKGDQWLYKVKDLLSGNDINGYANVVMEVADGKAWVMAQSRGRGWELFDNHLGRVIERRSYDENFDNNRGRVTETGSLEVEGADVQFPLEVGREYKVEYEMVRTVNEYRNGLLSSQRPEPMKLTASAKIESYEKIKVQTAEFDAYKIVLRGRVHSSSLNDVPKMQKIIWWAPTLKREAVIEYSQWDNRPTGYTAGTSLITRPVIHTLTELVQARLVK